MAQAAIPATMRAAQLLRFGLERANFTVNEVPVPVIKDNEVLIKVCAAAAGPGDYKIARGDLSLIFRALPRGLGYDVSGVVVKTGDKCDRIKEGDAVYANTAMHEGTFAEYMACPEAHVALKPRTLDHVTAACVPVSGLTAYQALKHTAQLKPGQKLLVLGGTGGVGSFAVQMGKAMGAYVAATASQVEIARGLGADEVINYKEQDVGEALKGQNYDVVLDCVGGREHWEAGVKVLKKGGHYVAVAGDVTDAPLGVGFIMTTATAVLGRAFWAMLGSQPKYTMFMTNAAAAADLDAIRELIDDGKVRVLLDPTPPFTLDTVYDMLVTQASHRVKGKLRLEVLKEAS